MDAHRVEDRNQIGARVLTFALLAAVAVLLLPFVSGLLGAGILYVMAAPLLKRLQIARTRQVGAVVTVFVLFAVLVLPGVWLLTELVGQIPETVSSLQRSPAVQRLMSLRIGTLDLGSQLQSATSDIVRWSSRQTLAVLGGVMNATINLVIALFGTYYLLIAADRVWDHTKRMLPFGATTSELLRMRFHRVTEAMLIGVALTGAAQGTLVGLALALLGFDHALFWGAVTAVVSIVPMFGSALVWLPASGILVAQQRFGGAIALITFGVVVVSNVDNVLRLIVYRRVSHIHPMVTLVGAFAGVKAFGLAGLLLGPLILSYALELMRVYHIGEREVAAAPTVVGQGFPVPGSTISPTPVVARNL